MRKIHGSNPAREIWRLTRSLSLPVSPRALPAGVTLTPWREEAAHAVHALLELSYRDGGGSVDPFDEWREWFTSDAEFEPASCFLAWQGQTLVGVALCWSSAFVKDLCVAPHFRRRGLASGLLAAVIAHFGRRGALMVELRSRSDNPSGANELYRKMGFVNSET
jgi:ribosomal protein S18 acetylase RimI-like enzyme